MKKIITFRLEEEMIERLRRLSKETYIPQVKLAEMAIEDLIKKKEEEAKKLERN